MNGQPDSRHWQPSDPEWQQGRPGSDDDPRMVFRDRSTGHPGTGSLPLPEPLAPEPDPSAPADTKLRVRDWIWLVAVCGGVLALIVGSCVGIRWAMDPHENEGTPIPREAQAVPSPSWTPSDGDAREIELKLRYALEQRTLEAAGVGGPMTSKCEYGNPLPPKCTVEYRGFTMRWDITHISGTDWIKYEAHTGSIVVTREGIQAAFARRHQSSYELRCDELPEIALVPVGKPLDPACYEQTERNGPSDRVKIVPSDQGAVGFDGD